MYKAFILSEINNETDYARWTNASCRKILLLLLLLLVLIFIIIIKVKGKVILVLN
jgi:uncharacterized membrane protein YhdT